MLFSVLTAFSIRGFEMDLKELKTRILKYMFVQLFFKDFISHLKKLWQLVSHLFRII